MLPRLVYVTRVLTPAGYDHVHGLLCDMANNLVAADAAIDAAREGK